MKKLTLTLLSLMIGCLFLLQQSSPIYSASGGVAANQVSDTAYSAAWNGVKGVAPSKNAVYDKINSMAGAGDLLSTNNLSDVATAATARSNLGLAIGTNVQAYSARLGVMGAIVKGATNSIYGVNGSGTEGWYTNVSSDDSAAQFYSATASKGTLKMLLTSMSDGILGTFLPVCTGACTFTTETYGAGTYTLVDKTSAQALTNKILTAPLIQSKEIIASTNTVLVATNVYGTRINNYGQTAPMTATMPTVDYGMDVVFVMGTGSATTFTVASATASTIYYNGSVATSGVYITSPAIGDYFVFYSFQTGASTWKWIVKSGRGTIVAY